MSLSSLLIQFINPFVLGAVRCCHFKQCKINYTQYETVTLKQELINYLRLFSLLGLALHFFENFDHICQKICVNLAFYTFITTFLFMSDRETIFQFCTIGMFNDVEDSEHACPDDIAQ